MRQALKRTLKMQWTKHNYSERSRAELLQSETYKQRVSMKLRLHIIDTCRLTINSSLIIKSEEGDNKLVEKIRQHCCMLSRGGSKNANMNTKNIALRLIKRQSSISQAHHKVKHDKMNRLVSRMQKRLKMQKSSDMMVNSERCCCWFSP